MRWIVGAVLALCLTAPVRAGDDPAAPPLVPQYDGRSAAEWTSLLASDDVKLRRKAAYALFNLGLGAKDAAPALVKALSDADPYVRSTSARAVEKLGPETMTPFATELASAMSDESEGVRREAAGLLWRLGPVAKGAVPELTKAIASSDEIVRAKAAWCLGNAGAAGKPALEALTKAIADPADDVRKGAANAIAKIDPATAFASDRTPVRLAALQVYGDSPSNKEWTDPVIVGGVLKAIDDRDEEVRNWAVHTLDTFAVFAGDARPVEWIPVFLRVLETQRAAGPRAAAAYGLGRYKDHAAEVVPLLVAAGKSRDPEVKTAAILALGWLGPEAKAAVPLALEGLRDDDVGVRSAAAAAIAAFGVSTDEVIDALARLTSESDRSVCRNAISSLGALGKGSARVASVLTDYLLRPDADPYVCPEAVRMLVAGGTEKAALSKLSGALEKGGKAPLSVAYALCALDSPESARAVARLTSALGEESDPNVVLAYLRMLGPKAAAATSAVVPFLADEVAQTRILAAVALGTFGLGAKEAIPALERLAKDPEAHVVLAAKQAIEEIRAAPAPPK